MQIHNTYMILISFLVIQVSTYQRGVWVTNSATDALDSLENVIKTVKSFNDSNLNSIYLDVWNGGYTLYPSKIMADKFNQPVNPKFKGRDVLQEVITEAKKYNIQVYCWFEYGFAAYHDGQNSTFILDKYPQWKAINSTDQPLVQNGFHWMNSFLPEVQNFMSSLMFEIVENYDIEGIQGDDRFPASPIDSGYDSYTQNLYFQKYKVKPPKDPRNSVWTQFRADQLTTFLQRFYRQIKQIKQKNIIFSSAPGPYPFGFTDFLQDWPKWYKLKIADNFCPQIYRYDINLYKSLLESQNNITQGKNTNIYPGVLISVGGGYVANETLVTEMVQVNRNMNYQGEIFFYHEGLKNLTNFFQNIYPNIKKQQNVDNSTEEKKSFLEIK